MNKSKFKRQMKRNLLLASALLISVVAFGQKKELRDIAKQIKKGELDAAQSALSQIKSAATSNNDYASEYYFLEGQLNVESAKKNKNVLASLQNASTAFAKVKELEGDKGSHATSIQALSGEAVNIAVKQAQDAYGRNDYKNSAVAFEQVYRLSPVDTVFLYNAAVVAVQNKDYSTALKHYKELKDIGYDGTETTYVAKNKQNGEEESFANKNQRDLMVKAGSHSNPRTEVSPSKRAEIIKNIALIHVEQGNTDEALKAFEDAKKLYPDDASIVMNEANIYLQLDNKDKFKELMEEAARLEPKNADVQYNIGVINMQQNHMDEAREAFKKALVIRPDYADAALNYSTTYINEGNALIEEMNALGNSKADIQKYDGLKAKKDALFSNGAKVLEDYMASQGKNEAILEQLKNIYGALAIPKTSRELKI